MSVTILSRVGPLWPDGRFAMDLARWIEQFTKEPVWIRPIKTSGLIADDIRQRFVLTPAPTEWELYIKAEGLPDMKPAVPTIKQMVLTWEKNKQTASCLEIARWMVDKGIIRGWRRPIPENGGGESFYHSGNLGDIIYGLYAIREAGGGQLLIGDKMQNKTLFTPTSREQFKMLEPLLEAQEYLKNCAWRPYYPAGEIRHDLNAFRDWWQNWALRQWENIHNLAEMQFYYLDIREKFDQEEPWIDVPKVIEHDRIVIHRSPRYNQTDSPWYWLTANMREHLLFVGLPEEHADFEKKFGPVSYWKCRDFLELAMLIAGSEGFCGNQSFPMSLAIGIGQRVWQETKETAPDCIYKRGGFYNESIEVVRDWV